MAEAKTGGDGGSRPDAGPDHRPPGRIVVLGGVSPDEAPRSLGIDMLVAGGKTGTLTQFTELARRAGLEVLAAGSQAPGRFVVECRSAKEPRKRDSASGGTARGKRPS